jgi:23S rRNA (cytosine1962-C5)-methyltransferase
MLTLPRITLHKAAEDRQRRWHPWVFSNEIADPKMFRQYPPGTEVEVLSFKGDFLGVGFAHPNSLIAIRIFNRKKGVRFNEDFVSSALKAAIERREAFFPQGGPEGGTYRAVFGESDGFPGLILDRFQGAWVMEPHSLAMAQRKELIADCLSPWLENDALVYRTDSRSASLEGVQAESLLLRGKEPSQAWAVEGRIRYPVDPMAGQKTGFFFDQRENRRRWGELIKLGVAGSEAESLDLFCHLGAWGFAALAAGAKHSVFVDRSQEDLDGVKAIAASQGWSEKVTLVRSDGKEFLERKDRKFSAIALDPPALIPSRKSLSQGAKEYRALNFLAIGALNSGGLLATSSCSYHLTEERFEEELALAMVQANSSGQIIHRGGLSPDHPLIPAMSEGRYLKNLMIGLLRN